MRKGTRDYNTEPVATNILAKNKLMCWGTYVHIRKSINAVLRMFKNGVEILTNVDMIDHKNDT